MCGWVNAEQMKVEKHMNVCAKQESVHYLLGLSDVVIEDVGGGGPRSGPTTQDVNDKLRERQETKLQEVLSAERKEKWKESSASRSSSADGADSPEDSPGNGPRLHPEYCLRLGRTDC